MMIDQFTKEDFEEYLTSNHSPFEYIGLNKGEHIYSLPLDNQTSIVIRSSIRDDNLSASVGKDSVRFWLEDNNGKPISSKMARTHRTEGWQERLSIKIDQLILWRALAGDCKECGKPKGIFKAKTEKNAGRPFAKCRKHNGFQWLDEPVNKSDIYFSQKSILIPDGLEIKESNNDTSEVAKEERSLLAYSTKDKQSKDTLLPKSAGELSKCTISKQESEDLQGVQSPSKEKLKLNLIGEKNETGNDKSMDTLAHDNKRQNNTLQSESAISESTTKQQETSLAAMPGLSGEKRPNEQQRAAIETDINANLRVLAGPGSGKTFVIALRYKHLVDNGINPTNIVVCTFGKEASLEMAKRIRKLAPSANIETICTINALCHRLLTKWDTSSRWYGWKMPKEWQIKQMLEDVIGPIWQEKEKPTAKEVMAYINTSKANGLSNDDSYEWFCNVLDSTRRGQWLYQIRCKFDAWLNRSKFITYADQLYLVEQRLKTDENWRTSLQEKFTHIVVDESQDCSFQAMRILVTIGLEPGMNVVYEVK